MKVTADKLRKVCNPDDLELFGFETSDDLPGQEIIVGQKRALEALRVGTGVREKDFNIFITGEIDSGKTRLVKNYLTEVIKKQAAGKDIRPPDFCYVYNFNDPDEPTIIELPAGQAKIFKNEMSDFISLLRNKIPLLFETEEWLEEIRNTVAPLKEQFRSIFEKLNEKAKEHGCIILSSPNGMIVGKAHPDDSTEPMKPQMFQKLPREEQKKFIEEDHPLVEAEMKKAINEQKRVGQANERIERELKKRKTDKLFAETSDDLYRHYEKNPGVLAYLESLREDIAQNLGQFLNNGAGCSSCSSERTPLIPGLSHSRESFFSRYEINIFVDNSQIADIPVIVETHPTYSNLFGGIKTEVYQGILTSHFSNIKAGAVQKANGGYLIIPALNIFKQPPMVWECLKRTIKDGEIKIDSSVHYFGGELKTLKPSPMPFSGKIILIGEPWLFYSLYEFDDQFKSVFKIKVELEERIDRKPETIKQCFGYLSGFCQRNDLLPFDRTAGARIIDYLSEMAESQKKISTRLGEAENILKEANFWAKEKGGGKITSQEIEKALRKKEERVNLQEQHLLEHIRNEILKITTDGPRVGQINGLVVYQIADYAFGLPTRITAKTAKEEKMGIINVEKESGLAGKFQIKSVLEVAGYIRGRYAEKSLPVSVSLCFEQSYGGVEGDSASLAELFVTLSALSEIPLRQDLAITGSMNQDGAIQAIGGVNSKIKGFFKICRDRGFTGRQGVIIPKDILNDLMLPNEIVDAVKEKKFHIYAISTPEEGIKYLTGLEMEDIDRAILKRFKQKLKILQFFKKIIHREK